jgi:hypothetical protein
MTFVAIGALWLLVVLLVLSMCLVAGGRRGTGHIR